MKNRMDKFLHSRSYVDMESVAADLAAADADDQAFFLNVFFRAMKVNCEDLYRFNMQLSYIGEKLNHEARLAHEFLGSEATNDQ